MGVFRVSAYAFGFDVLGIPIMRDEASSRERMVMDWGPSQKSMTSELSLRARFSQS